MHQHHACLQTGAILIRDKPLDVTALPNSQFAKK